MNDYGFFPLYLDVRDRNFLVVGGGRIAKHKVEQLRRFTDRIVVIARETDLTGVKVVEKDLELSDLAIADFVIAATDDVELNRRIAAFCGEREIPVNVVNDPSLCTFLFPSVIQRGDLQIAISTGGASPAFSRRMRQTLEAAIPDHTAEILQRMRTLRQTLPEQISDQRCRAACYEEILDYLFSEEASDAYTKDPDVWDVRIADIVRHYADCQGSAEASPKTPRPCNS